MTKYDDGAAMREAEAKWAHQNALINEYMNGRDMPAKQRGDISPYIAPVETEDPDTGALLPSQVRTLKMAGGLGAIGSACVAFVEQAATGAFNTLFGWAFGGFALLFLFSGAKGAISSGRSGEGRSSGGEHHHHHYYQNNSFGGNANQRNN